MWKRPRSWQSAFTDLSAASVYTAPVGLFGLTVTIARVRDDTAARRVSGPILVGVRLGIGERFARDADRRFWRAVVHDTLAERDRVGYLADEVADHGDNRRLHSVHARTEFQRLNHLKDYSGSLEA